MYVLFVLMLISVLLVSHNGLTYELLSLIFNSLALFAHYCHCGTLSFEAENYWRIFLQF